MSDDWPPNDWPPDENSSASDQSSALIEPPLDQQSSFARCVSIVGALLLWIVLGATQALRSPMSY